MKQSNDLPWPEQSWRKISPADGHYFFGYYDRQPWNKDQTLHLALKAPQQERLPIKGERAEVGVIETAEGRFRSLAQTRAWCHQQGAMTMWLKHRPDHLVFNDWDEAKGGLVARVYALDKGLVDAYERALYVISPDGKWGASLNFSRIPRRGYSYADASFINTPADLDEDGVFLINLHTGDSRLVVSYREILEVHPAVFMTENKHLWLNHIMFNSDSSKLLFLQRHSKGPDGSGPWHTFLYTADIDGSHLRCPFPDFYWKGVSHQIWGRTPNEILVDANWQHTGNEYVVFDESILPIRAKRISEGMGPMGHLVFSPDGSKILADTYAKDGKQRVGLVDVKSGQCRQIGSFEHTQPSHVLGDVRCDLHPRWSRDGSLVSVDSIHQKHRGIYCRRIPQ